MKELVKAQRLFQEIKDLDQEIIKIEFKLDEAISNKADGSLEFTINLDEKEKLKLDEDGSITSNDLKGVLSFTFPTGLYCSSSKEDAKDKFKLDEVDLIIILGTLLNIRQEKRKKLIKEFNDLSLKIKI